jgi:hypothetical protein
MQLSIRITVYVFLLVFFIGCTKPLVLPEEIYVTPQYNYYHNLSKVGLFNFKDPSNAPGLGKAAAQYLYRELLKNKVFLNITFEFDIANIQTENLVKIAKAKKYDLIITGDLLHCFEGGNFAKSHVEEEMRIIRVIGKKTKTLWYAIAVEIGAPNPSTDYIIIQSEGTPAPSALALMKRNAKKFCSLLQKDMIK